jgi:hypothetical protein
LAFHGYKPSAFNLMEMKLARLNGDAITDVQSRLDFLDDLDVYSRVEWKPKTKPSNAHTVPFVTGQHYHMHW